MIAPLLSLVVDWWPVVAGALGGALALLARWWTRHDAVQQERARRKLRDAEAYRETTEAVDDAVADARDVPADRWLRDYLSRHRDR